MADDYQQESSEQCSVEPLENADETIGRLLAEVRAILATAKQEDPDSEATTTLETDLTLADTEYDALPGVMDDYKKQIHDFEQKLEEAERQQKQLEALTDDEYNPGDDIRDAILKLFNDSYEKEENRLRKAYGDSKIDFSHAMSCLDQAKRKTEESKAEYEEIKDYKNTVSGWFADLAAMYASAMEHMKTGNDRALYAYRLEFEKVLKEARKIPLEEERGKGKSAKRVDGLSALKTKLSKRLRDWIIAIYEQHYWHKDWLEKEAKENSSNAAYENFKTTRREDFIREAMDVPADGQQIC